MAAPAFGAAARGGGWGKAIEVPGLAGLNAGHGGTLTAVSCSSPGDCAATGNYADRGGLGQAFVVSERNGSWGKAIEVPGLAALNNGGYAGISSVSCASAGNCAVTGYYDSGAPEAFVVSQANGSWGRAIEVPGSAAFGTATFASVSWLRPATAQPWGTPVAPTTDASFGPLAVSEKNGSWGKAISVPGTAASARNAAVSVSCGSPGNCAAGGNEAPIIYGPYQAFVAREQNGSWGKATGIPGLAALNAGGNAEVLSVSCGSAGGCSAGGYYQDGSGHQQAFVASENNGAWGTALEVPGSGTLNAGGFAQVMSVSCTSAGYCAAGGYYLDGAGTGEAFVISRT